MLTRQTPPPTAGSKSGSGGVHDLCMRSFTDLDGALALVPVDDDLRLSPGVKVYHCNEVPIVFVTSKVKTALYLCCF